MTETHLGQIKIDGEWRDYARSTRDEAFDWASRDPDERRVVHWIYKERVLFANGEPVPVFGEFDLNIRVAHAAMQTSADVANALRKVADTLDAESLDDITYARTILDANGQSVGTFTYAPDKD